MGIGSQLDHIPLIDISPLYGTDREAKAELARQLHQTCTDLGFLYIVGHGVPPEITVETFAEAGRFFALPQAEKDRISVKLSDDYRGYTAVLGENNDNSALGDVHESFDFAMMMSPEANVWPQVLPSLRPVAERYADAMLGVARTLIRGFALALGLDEHHFDAVVTRPMGQLRFLHYPPQDGVINEAQIGTGAHTDFEAFTILTQQEGITALQVLDRTGNWIDATPIPGAFVVNIGDMMQRWTNNVFRSTCHRVINKSGKERQSIPFFFGPNEDTVIEALPLLIDDDHPPLFPPVLAVDYLRERMDAAYGTAPASAA